MFRYILSCILFLGFALQAQVPNTEIYLIDCKISKKGLWSISDPLNVTRHQGYDNQPSFSPDGQFMYYVSIKGEGKSDIFRYNLASGEVVNVSNSPSTSEYSTMVSPDGSFLSVVVVEADDSTQRIWKLPFDGTAMSPLIDHHRGVGYYAWNEDQLATFVLGEPYTLQVVAINDSSSQLATGHIGRCLQKIPGKNSISFVHKIDEDRWEIKALGMSTFDIMTLNPVIEQSEDYVWLPDGRMLMGADKKLYAAKIGESWKMVADLSGLECADFYRLAIHPNGRTLALVSYQGEKP